MNLRPQKLLRILALVSSVGLVTWFVWSEQKGSVVNPAWVPSKNPESVSQKSDPFPESPFSPISQFNIELGPFESSGPMIYRWPRLMVGSKSAPVTNRFKLRTAPTVIPERK
jgi:hypothetical protein